MTKLILNDSAVDQFRNVTEPVEVFDEAGHRIGFFNPDQNRALYENIEVPFTDEDLKRWESEPGGRTLDEILRDLEKRQ